MTITTSTTDNTNNSGIPGGEDDVQVSGAIEAEDAMAMEEAMTMIAAGDLNDFSDDDDDENNAKADDESSVLLLGATATTAAAATTEDTPMDLPPPLPPLPGLKPPPEEASDDDDIAIAIKYNQSKATYYAVRVGYVVGESNGDPVVVSTIRSAIFLRWEDVKHFVEFATSSSTTTANQTQHSAGENEASSINNKDSEGVVLPGTPFHHNVEYKVFHDIALAERYLSKGSDSATTAAASSSSNSTSIRIKKKSKSTKHKLLLSSMQNKMRITVPAKSFNPITKKWLSMYDMALQYKATYGNLDVPSSSKEDNYSQHEDLSKWIKYQRSSYRSYLEDPMGGKHSMTEEKVNQLEAAGFTWIHSDKKAWLEEESSSMRAKKKRGRPRKTAKMVAKIAAMAAHRGHNSILKPIRSKWLATLQQLKEYKERTNSVDIPEEETEEGLVALRLWLKGQKNLYCRWRQGYDVGMTQEKADMLKEVGVEFPPSWEDMYAKALQYKVQHGNSLHGVSKSDDPILAAWVARQDEILSRHLQGKGTRLSDDQAIKLLNLGVNGGRASAGGGTLLFGGGAGGSGGSGKILAIGRTEASLDFDAKWNAMYEKLQAFKAEHGHCNVNTTTGTDLAHWVAAQRRMYNKLVSGKPGKRAALDAVKMQRLTELGFSFRPRGSYTSWEDQMTALWRFRQENGHCRVPVNHPTLGSFVKLVRRDYKNWTLGKPSSMTVERETALKTVGFTFEGGKTPQRTEGPIKTWEERLEELVQFKAEFGHTVVPQNSGQLGAWVHSQRVHYKKFKAGEKSQMTAEKALRLTEIGFCFNASDRFRGNKGHRSNDQAATEVLQQPHQQQLQQQNPHHLQLQQHHEEQQQHYQQQQHHHHQMQEMVHVPQGFQPYI